MTKQYFKTICLLFLAMLGMAQTAAAETAFKDFSVIVNNQAGTLLTSEEQVAGTAVNFGVAVADNGTVSRVAAGDASAVATVSGTFHSDHGCTDLSVVVPVSGPVAIQIGTCSFSGSTITVKNAANETVISRTPTGSKSGEGEHVCWKNDHNNIIEVKYTGEATTLTISGMTYCPYVAVKAVDATAVNVTYSLGDVVCEGALTLTGGTYAAGDEYTIPAKNFTLYKEGYTLTAWSDGTNQYAAGSTITLPSEDVTLTPVFTANEVSLADRTEPVTVKFDFMTKDGAPAVEWSKRQDVWVTQVEVNGKTIDVATHFDTNNNGKFANKNWDWCAQVNGGTTFNIPSCKGATVSMQAFSEITTTTIDGQSDYTHGNTISYEIGNTADNIDIVIGDGSYYYYIQVVLPVVQSTAKTYTDEAASVVWNFNSANDYATVSSVAPEGAFSTTSFNLNGATVTGTGTSSNLSGVTFVKIQPANGATDKISWTVKPAAGLTFTPTKVSGKINRGGTDVDNGVTISVKAGDGAEETLANYTALRFNKTTADDAKKNNSNLANSFDIELTETQKTALTTTGEFILYSTVGVANNKEGYFSDIHIEGLINGTAADVAKYTLDIAASPAEGGSVTKYPNSDEYEEGSTIKVTATENFGYNFENWTDESGTEVSKEPVYQFDIAKNEKLTANFVAVNTYELKLTVDGTNDYMVKVSPAPTVVDGKNMYEAGTAVELTADQYEGLVTFTNWSDGETNSKKTISMTEDVTLTANYAEADIIAGWDFYKAGNNGRVADFAAQDNDADALNLVKTGTTETSGWLDKSTLGGGGYESFKGAATNWRTGSSNGDVGNYHWQTKVNAEAFTDIKVQFQMMYNYNAYQKYNAEYSLNGTDWTNFGSITMSGAKAPASFSETLPAEANNQKDLYIRMIADKASSVDGTPSQNDGNTLAMFFITGTPKLVDDGTAPVLVSSVPANNATGASASGKIVLNFDEKVKVADAAKATLGSLELTPAVSGKVVTFDYKGLEYNSEYTFTLPANSVADQTDNYLAEAITINFTTMNRPSVTKKLYDQVVSTTDELVAAINAANSRADKNTRYRIFVKNGEYTIPLSSTMKTVNGYEVPECITSINGSNTSFIGESRDGVVITNGIEKSATFEGQYGTTSKYDGIGNSDVFQISSSTSGLYWQDLTVSTGMDDATGRDLAIQDKGTMNIYKNVKLHGFQDTWTSNNDNGLYYFEDGVIRGRTDYICGKGDIYFNRVEFRQIAGGYAAVPSKPAKVGWVMKDCVINGEAAVTKMENGVATQRATAEQADGNYTLGRPWGKGTPVALWIDTKMNVVPSAIGWEEMSGGFPKRFAEYNSTTKTGNVIDLSGRKDVFDAYDEKKEVIVDNVKTYEYVNRRNEHNSPVLTAAEALEYSDMSKMFGDWTPTLATEQAPVPQNVKQNGNNLEWDDSNYALLYAVVKDGEIIDFTTENSYEMPEDGTYSVRAANEMGGLSEASATVEATGVTTGIQNVKTADEAPVITGDIYTLQGVRVDKARKGLYIIGGRKVVIK